MNTRKSFAVSALLAALLVALFSVVSEQPSLASIGPEPDGPEINLKPGSNPNCLNTSAGGLNPVAILGSASFDVTTVVVSTVTFAGASAVRCNVEDVSPHEGDTPDGFADLVCHFKRSEMQEVPPGGCVELTLTAQTTSGESIEATDIACGPPCNGAEPGN